MTLKDLRDLETFVQRQRFLNRCSDPIFYGIEKAAFEEEQLQKLIKAARELNSHAVDRKLLRWSRQLEKTSRSRVHLEKLRDQLRPQPRSRFAVPCHSVVPPPDLAPYTFSRPVPGRMPTDGM